MGAVRVKEAEAAWLPGQSGPFLPSLLQFFELHLHTHISRPIVGPRPARVRVRGSKGTNNRANFWWRFDFRCCTSVVHSLSNFWGKTESNSSTSAPT